MTLTAHKTVPLAVIALSLALFACADTGSRESQGPTGGAPQASGGPATVAAPGPSSPGSGPEAAGTQAAITAQAGQAPAA